MLSVDVITIFPRMVEAPLADSIVARAVERGIVAFGIHDLRDYADDKHRAVDDAPFGGGPGMVMKAEPFFRAVEALPAKGPSDKTAVVLLSPRGRRFDQATAERYSTLDHLVLLCGRYEGIDERVAASGIVTEEVSLGDFVLTGGEVAALAIIEATIRLLPGALGDAESADCDSFADGVLDWPHYTRPATIRGQEVPEVLLSGDHGKVARWRRKEALRATRERRPELLAEALLSGTDRELLLEIEQESRGDEELNPRTAAPESPLATTMDRVAIGRSRIH
jgi:tRNA (guanine37-N1)-methyltransferase